MGTPSVFISCSEKFPLRDPKKNGQGSRKRDGEGEGEEVEQDKGTEKVVVGDALRDPSCHHRQRENLPGH
jgi:hypothetical protein